MPKRNNILFYYPRHFNRTEKGNNPFFESLTEVCDRHNISYKMVEEPDYTTDKPSNSQSIKFDFFLHIIFVLRKLIPLKLFEGFSKRDEFIGRCIGYFTFNYFKADLYITISNSMINLLHGLNPKAKVYDLQHGIIFSEHSGYFNSDKSLKEHLKADYVKLLLYGKGFASSFEQNEDNINYLKTSKIKIIGQVINENETTNKQPISKMINVIFSLRFISDLPKEELIILKKKLEDFLDENKSLFEKRDLKLILKHHPRYYNVLDLSDLKKRFKFVETYNEQIHKPETVFLHVTRFSTAAFDWASHGIPTFFVYDEFENKGKTIFLDEFDYPIKASRLETLLESYLNDNHVYEKDRELVFKWYLKFYEPFDESLFLNIINDAKVN